MGVGIDPSAVGLGGGSSSTGVNATGRTQRIQVTAKEGLRFEPASAKVSRGDRVIIELSNADATMIHDLKLGDATTPRLSVGETAELDLGVVGESIEGWCTVVGHRQAGMVFTLKVSGQDASTSQDGTTGGGHDHAPAQANSAPLNTVVDPVAPAATEETIHRVEMRVTELPLEVAPGVWQKRWTFNGGPVGPTLRGKVGDVFEVTLINDGTISHSIKLGNGDQMAGFAAMNKLTYGEAVQHARGPIACIDCHDPQTMQLRIIRPAFIAGGTPWPPGETAERQWQTGDRRHVHVCNQLYAACRA